MTALSFRFSGCWLSRLWLSTWPQRWHRMVIARDALTLVQRHPSDCSVGRGRIGKMVHRASRIT